MSKKTWGGGLRGVLVALAAGAIALLPASALAAEVRTGDTILVPAGEAIRDDVYAFGNNVTIQGTVDGDVIAAGSTITINGHVTGDLMAAGNTVIVSGPVDGTVRTAGSALTISGPVGRDALAAGSTLTVSGSGGVGRDVLAAGGSIDLLGPIGRDVKASGGRLTVGSSVGGAVQAEVSDLTFENGATVQGPVSYVSGKDASVAPGAQVQGPIERTEPPTKAPDPWVVGGIDLLGLVRGFVGLAALGLVLALLFPRTTLTAGETARRRWPASLGLGFGVLVGTPLVAALVFGLGLAVGGWWIGLLLLGAYALLVVLGYLVAAESVGLAAARLGGWKVHPTWDLLLGLAILGLLTLVPFVGWLVGLIAIVLGLGALTLTAWEAYRGAPTAHEPPIAAPTPLPVAA